ncbi:MAG: hypothetical protein RL497_1766 [Pseudomonadota bacterium]
MSQLKPQPTALPPSCTSQPITWVGIVCMLACLFCLRLLPPIALSYQVLLILACYVLPIAFLEWKYLKPQQRPSSGLDFTQPPKPANWRRVFTKLLGLYSTLGLMAFLYSLIPEYIGGFYTRYWQFIYDMAVLFIPASVIYFSWVDRRMRHPEDGYYQLGCFLMGQTQNINTAKIRQHLTGWGVKFFFLPLMFIYSLGFFEKAKQWNFFDMNFWQTQGYSVPTDLFYGIDVVIVTVGYLCTFRIFDSHIRSAEPTAAGWLWALICYEPIWSFVAASYINYNSDGFEWHHWLDGNMVMQGIWGGAILILTFIYMLASVGFGLRFSNLTNRGIITNGVYAWCKHPAYVSKNISWWLIAVPFIWHDKATALTILRDCMALLALNGIYYLRARTEERHLSSDPTYVAYATAMNERSIFAPLARALPFLRYRPSAVLVDLKEYQ